MLPNLDSASPTQKFSTVDQENHSELLENTRLFHVPSRPVFTDQNGPFQSLSSPLPQSGLFYLSIFQGWPKSHKSPPSSFPHTPITVGRELVVPCMPSPLHLAHNNINHTDLYHPGISTWTLNILKMESSP